MRRALFLDRDGTINVDYGYVFEPEKFVFIDGVFEFCREARKKGYLIIVVTNQSGIERGYFSERDFDAMTRHMVAKFAENGVAIDDVFYCPSLSGEDRKPKAGMFLKAQAKWNIDMANSLNIGDKERDLEAGRAAGVGVNILFKGDYGALMPYLHDAN